MHYHVIDLDPYGTAAPFSGCSSTSRIVDGGLLCVTCTDAGVFASLGYLEKTYSQYAGLPSERTARSRRRPPSHPPRDRHISCTIRPRHRTSPLSLHRLLRPGLCPHPSFTGGSQIPREQNHGSSTVAMQAAEHGPSNTSPVHAKRRPRTATRSTTSARHWPRQRARTASTAASKRTRLARCGADPLHNPHFIQRILDMLPTLDEYHLRHHPSHQRHALSRAERDPRRPSLPTHRRAPRLLRRHPRGPIPPTNPATRAQHPFFFLPSALSRVLHCVVALRRRRPRRPHAPRLPHYTRSHTKAGSICTDAPWSVVWEVMREWVRQKSPIKEGTAQEGNGGMGNHEEGQREMRS